MDAFTEDYRVSLVMFAERTAAFKAAALAAAALARTEAILIPVVADEVDAEYTLSPTKVAFTL